MLLFAAARQAVVSLHSFQTSDFSQGSYGAIKIRREGKTCKDKDKRFVLFVEREKTQETSHCETAEIEAMKEEERAFRHRSNQVPSVFPTWLNRALAELNRFRAIRILLCWAPTQEQTCT